MPDRAGDLSDWLFGERILRGSHGCFAGIGHPARRRCHPERSAAKSKDLRVYKPQRPSEYEDPSTPHLVTGQRDALLRMIRLWKDEGGTYVSLHRCLRGALAVQKLTDPVQDGVGTMLRVGEDLAVAQEAVDLARDIDVLDRD